MTINAEGCSPFVLVCDHASNRIPAPYGDLGLTPAQRLMHIAWDPGALAVSLQLTELLDAPLVHSTVSRLVVDCNRVYDAPDLIPAVSEFTEVPGNKDVDAAERQARIAQFHTPFHAAITALLDRRAAAGQQSVLVAIHSFTPTFKGVPRPWPIGLVDGADDGLSRALLRALQAEAPGLNIGWNEPYAARQGVTYTLEHHGDARGLEATMIEIRHDEILEPAGVALWSRRLAYCLTVAHETRGKSHG